MLNLDEIMRDYWKERGTCGCPAQAQRPTQHAGPGKGYRTIDLRSLSERPRQRLQRMACQALILARPTCIVFSFPRESIRPPGMVSVENNTEEAEKGEGVVGRGRATRGKGE
jgi:hypothetical protein